MNPKTAELVAIGASVSSNYHPCARFHVRKAIEVGQMVRKGAAGQMDELIGEIVGKDLT